MDIDQVMAKFPSTRKEDWRKQGEAWVHTDCDISDFVGVFLGGVFRGGMFHGGVFLGGVFLGGVFHGGVFHGGVFLGGVFHGGVFHGGQWGRSPVFVQGTAYPVAESDNGHITSGCIRLRAERWTEDKVRIAAKENGYTDEQVAEYQEIFRFVRASMKRTGSVV